MGGFENSLENFCHGSTSEQLLKIYKMLFLVSELISNQEFAVDQSCTHTHPHTHWGAPCAATGCNQAVTGRDKTCEHAAKSHTTGAGGRSLQRNSESPEFSLLEFQETFIPTGAATYWRDHDDAPLLQKKPLRHAGDAGRQRCRREL